MLSSHVKKIKGNNIQQSLWLVQLFSVALYNTDAAAKNNIFVSFSIYLLFAVREDTSNLFENNKCSITVACYFEIKSSLY